jgi:transcriptional regulator with XRE-family HTH domain
MQTIGERLEEARKKKGISIREAAEATKIRGDYLQKFEGNHFDIGLTEIDTRGFLRNYANFLKLPGDRLLNDYSALGRGEARPRQPSRDAYSRIDISVASAGEPSDRAAPPDEGAAAAEPTRAQPRYPRGSSSLPSGPDPAVIFRYVKWALAGVGALLAVWLVSSLISGRAAKPATVPAPALPPVATQTAVSTRAVITSLDVVRVQVWVKNEDNSYGDVVLPPTTLAKGETAAFNKAGPVYIYASAQENIRIDFSGKQFTPSAPPHNVRGALAIELR